MRRLLTCLLSLLLIIPPISLPFPILSLLLAWADGPQFNGTCSTISWNANTEIDLQGYRIYDRVSLANPSTLIVTVGPQITSVTCASLGLNPGQHYIAISAFDTSGNDSGRSNDIAFVIVVTNQISDLRVITSNATDQEIAFTEVDDGNSQPATYQVRFATPTIDWGSAPPVTNGTCAGVLTGTAIGATKTCTITSLSTTTPYQYQLVPYRGTLGIDAVFGPLSNITGATTGSPPPAGTDLITLASDSFPLGTTTELGINWTPRAGASNLAVVTNKVRAPSLGVDAAERYTGLTWPTDQWAQQTITMAGASPKESIVNLRDDGTGSNFYMCRATKDEVGNSSRISKVVAGVFSTIAQDNAATWVSTDVVHCRVVGTLISMYRNGAFLFSVTDASLSTGIPGLHLYTDGALSDNEADDWSGGTFSTAATPDTCGCDNH